MSKLEPSRRRFLAYAGALGGLGVVGGVAWASRTLFGDSLEAGSTTTSGPQATTLPIVDESPSTTAPTTASPASTTTTAGPPSATIAVICPEAWGALPVAGDFTPHTIERLTVHHTAAVLDDNRNAPARARQHQQFHQERGWADLAYHFLVDAHGNVYQGRPIEAVGDTGTEYDPTGHFLVCCEGNFSEQDITDPQLDALVGMLAWAAENFGVSPETISGHRDWAQTACPGDDLYSYIESGSIEQAVVDKMAGGGVQLDLVCGDEGLTMVADIEAGQA